MTSSGGGGARAPQPPPPLGSGTGIQVYCVHQYFSAHLISFFNFSHVKKFFFILSYHFKNRLLENLLNLKPRNGSYIEMVATVAAALT